MDTFKATHLLSCELNYELRLRGVESDRPHDQKRKILGRIIAKEQQQNFDRNTLSDSSYDPEVEKTEIEQSLKSIETLIKDFEGPTSDSAYKRAISRLEHIVGRIKRVRTIETDAIYNEMLKFKNESYATALELDAELHERVCETVPTQFHNSSVLGNTHITNNNPCNFSQPTACSSKGVPVYKLGIQFDGEPSKLLSFIEKVEELAEARNVSQSNLFSSASDLFTGKATYWFRQVKSCLSNWEDLVLKLKKDFLSTDFDEDIWTQIKSRRQGKTEPVVLFIACLETLFARLSRTPAETTKIRYIKLGLQREYQTRLALSDIDSVSTLSNLCKRLEEADVLGLATSSRTISCLGDPELAYISDRSSSSNSNTNVHIKKKFNNQKRKSVKPVNSQVNVTSSNKVISCWRCGLQNHTFKNCISNIKKKFCFKCGKEDTTSKECSCNKGN